MKTLTCAQSSQTNPQNIASKTARCEIHHFLPILIGKYCWRWCFSDNFPWVLTVFHIVVNPSDGLRYRQCDNPTTSNLNLLMLLHLMVYTTGTSFHRNSRKCYNFHCTQHFEALACLHFQCSKRMRSCAAVSINKIHWQVTEKKNNHKSMRRK